MKKVTVKDTTDLKAPTVSEITDKSTKVTGTVEKGATVTVKFGSNVYSTVAANGTYAVPLFLQKAETIFEVWATDAAGNNSTITKVTTKDKTAPKHQLFKKFQINQHRLLGPLRDIPRLLLKLAAKAILQKRHPVGALTITLLKT